MVYIGSGTKITDATFLSIKAILQKGQAALDAEENAFARKTAHEKPVVTSLGGQSSSTSVIVSDEPRKILQYNTTRVHEETLTEVLKIASEALEHYK